MSFSYEDKRLTHHWTVISHSQCILRPGIQPRMHSASANAYFCISQLTLLN